MLLLNQILLPLNKKSKNCRIYTEESLQNFKNEYYGELGTSNDSEIHLSNVSHYITNVKIENNNIIGDIKILDTNKGKELKELINSNIKFIFRPRSLGHIVNNYVEDAMIISFDAILESDDPYYNIKEERKEKLKKLNNL